MIDSFNKHYKMYILCWLSCLDKSINYFHDILFPCFMCVPCKPQPFRKKYHSITYGSTEEGQERNPIVWRVKIKDGKDYPKKNNARQAFPSKFQGYTKTTMLMLKMAKPVYHTGKVVSTDSGFCVSVGIISMHNHEVYLWTVSNQ